MKFGAHIHLTSMPFAHDPATFPRLKDLQVVYKFVKEGKVLGPFRGDTRFCPVTGHPLIFYPSFVVPKSTLGSYRRVPNASFNRDGPSINDLEFRLFNRIGWAQVLALPVCADPIHG